jgi:hypothetical protein
MSGFSPTEKKFEFFGIRSFLSFEPISLKNGVG